jgi:hypothetical protein
MMIRRLWTPDSDFLDRGKPLSSNTFRRASVSVLKVWAVYPLFDGSRESYAH